MCRKLCLIFIGLVLFSLIHSFGQIGKISGIAISNDGVGIENVRVLHKGVTSKALAYLSVSSSGEIDFELVTTPVN